MGLKNSLQSGTKKFGKMSPKKIIAVVVVALILGFIALLVVAIIAIVAIRWAWDSGSNAVQQNSTISSVVETTKQDITESLPNVPTSANDFIVNNQIDTTRLAETYSNLPAQTQEVWKSAIEQSITDSIQNATGADLTALQQLLTSVQAL